MKEIVRFVNIYIYHRDCIWEKFPFEKNYGYYFGRWDENQNKQLFNVWKNQISARYPALFENVFLESSLLDLLNRYLCSYTDSYKVNQQTIDL
jgi:hypothetical protein